MSIYFKWLTTKPTACAIGLIMLSATVFESSASTSRIPFDIQKRTIVLDPGHGGRDSGAIGPSGTLEKTIALQFVQKLHASLKQNYIVTLTRTADYALDNIERANIANHLRPDVFISIHTGGGFRPRGNGSKIFYFTPYAIPGKELSEPQPVRKKEGTSIGKQFWNELQHPHIASSRQLAETVHQSLRRSDTLSNRKIHSAPLLLLEGLDMPAILIEIGCLSNPTEEKRLNDPKHLERIVDAICHGIDTFFQNAYR